MSTASVRLAIGSTRSVAKRILPNSARVILGGTESHASPSLVVPLRPVPAKQPVVLKVGHNPGATESHFMPAHQHRPS